jgi:hypothetical protein
MAAELSKDLNPSQHSGSCASHEKLCPGTITMARGIVVIAKTIGSTVEQLSKT